MLVERVPGDAWGFLVLAQARVRLGEKADALSGFARVTELAPDTALAAEAQRERLACAVPNASLEIEAVLRAAETAPIASLEGISARGRSLAGQHGVWTAEFARGVAEKRLGRPVGARRAFEESLKLAAGATPSHLELVELCLALGDGTAALAHAERVAVLEGKTPRAVASLAVALHAVGRTDDAKEAARLALKSMPDDPRLRAISLGTKPTAPRPSFFERLKTKLSSK